MNIENTKLSEMSQREGHTLIYLRCAESANSRTEMRAEVTRGWEQGREAWETLPNSCKGFVWGDENCGDGQWRSLHNSLSTIGQVVHFKTVQMVTFTFR